MKTSAQAVKARIEQLLKEKNITLYRLMQNSGVLHGTMYGIISEVNKSVTLATLVKIAGGFDMTVSEFLDDELFFEDNLKV
jgi:transcriptional regulator with XRE-family HTH domain